MVPKIGIVGINGFGATHGRVILNLMAKGDLKCVAFADIKVDAEGKVYRGLVDSGAIHYTDYREMLDAHGDLDFVVISTPIALHMPMAVETLNRGFNVLLEKPPAVTVQDIDNIIEASKEADRICTVNFQMTSLRTFLQLNQLIEDGKLGEIERVIGVGIWKRTDEYYERTSWAGKLLHNGEYVLDGTINNPLAHLLNNCLIVAGGGDATAAMPISVQGELYKGHDIESEDTACVRIQTKNDVEVLFYTTLCGLEQELPYITVYGDRGKATWTYGNNLKVEYRDGREEEFAHGKEEYMENIYYNLMAVIRGTETRLLSSIESCKSFVLASNGAFESSRKSRKIPDEYIIREEEGNTVATYIRDIKDIIESAAIEHKLFSEISVDWAQATEAFSVEDYREFKLFKD